MANKQNKSPVIDVNPIVESSEGMSFSDAMREVMVGKKITKLEWKNKKIYGYLSPTTRRLTLHKEDDIDYDWIVNDGDLNGSDWKILE